MGKATSTTIQQIDLLVILLRSICLRGSALLHSTLAQAGRRLFAWAPVMWAGGILLYFAPRHEPHAAPAWLCFALGIALFGFGLRRLTLRVAAVGICLVSGGFLDARYDTLSRPKMPYLPRHAITVLGKVCGVHPMAPRREGQALTRRIAICEGVFNDWLNEGMAPLRRHILIRVKSDDLAPIFSGQRVAVRVMLYAPPWPAYPGARDLQREAWFSNLGGNGYALGPVEIRESNARTNWATKFDAFRQSVVLDISEHLTGQTGAIAQVLLTGEAGGISAQTRDIYAASGLAHLLAVAGLHLGLVMGFILLLMRNGLALWPRAALYWPCREISCVTALIVGAGYVFLTGAHLPALRSLGMAALVVFALVLGRRALSIRSWSLVAMGLLMMRPSFLLDVSFQMSFAAILALIRGYDALRPQLRRWHTLKARSDKLLVHIALLVLTSLFAGTATLPIVAAHFSVVQPWFIIANVVAVPIAGLIVMPMGVLALVTMPFHLEAPFLSVMGCGIALVTWIADVTSRLPLAHLDIPRAPYWGLIVYGLSLCMLCLTQGLTRAVSLVGIVVSLASPWLVPRPDLLVSSDAVLVGVRRGHKLYMSKPGFAQKRVAQIWIDDFRLTPIPLTALKGLPEVTCDNQGCEIRIRSHHLRINEGPQGGHKPGSPWRRCNVDTLIVNMAPSRSWCSGGWQIDRFGGWKAGAAQAYLRGDRIKIITDRSRRGARVWAPQNGNQGVPNLPPVSSEPARQ